MRVLVTGSAGFVGRHFARHFERERHAVVRVDVAPDVDAPWSSPVDCREVFEHVDEHFDLVVHCAAVVGGRLMIDGDPLTLAAEDLSIDAALFRWALKARPERVVYFSSSAAYPVALQHVSPDSPSARQNALQRAMGRILHEDDIDLADPKLPDQTYGWVKLTGERLCDEARRAGLHVHTFRPFSGYGGDQSLDYPFPSFVERARRRADPFEVWGHGEQVRDFVHIDDVVDAVLAAIDHDFVEPLNIGTGRATSFNELAQLAMELAGYEAPIAHTLDRPMGVDYRVADVSTLHTIYRPRVSLEEGIDRALKGRA